ncbi:hypothetical protein EJB05_02173, partial [Eragrostis curvula]
MASEIWGARVCKPAPPRMDSPSLLGSTSISTRCGWTPSLPIFGDDGSPYATPFARPYVTHLSPVHCCASRFARLTTTPTPRPSLPDMLVSISIAISDEFCGLEWYRRYNIIKGTCEGLKYLHEDLSVPLYHLDLKPDNILLDKDMVPKIADFGLSTMFGKEKTRIAQSPLGTNGYQPPEYINKKEISKKFDIFSLGVVMIKIISGPQGYFKCAYMRNDEFIDLVQSNWRNRLFKELGSCPMLEAYCRQIRICTQIALNCVDEDSMKRLDIVKIINKLNDIEADIGKLPREGSHNTVSGLAMHHLITKVGKEPKEITDQQQNLNFMISPTCHELESVDIREKSSDGGQGYIVGRTEEKKEILSSLLESMTQKIIILPIYGIGGIGKTTFAKMIYNDINFKHYSRVWVYVSPRFDLNKIGNSIISQVSGNESQVKGKREIDNRLKNLLSDKKILIVLDDLWEDNSFQLKDLKDMLNLGESINTVILVTTRNERVAEKICTNHKPYKINSLTNDMCWHVIKEKCGFEARDDREQLRDIGWNIALKCGGVALAAQSLGYMLQSMTFDEWMKVKDSDIWNESISEDVSLSNHVLASLKLSYNKGVALAAQYLGYMLPSMKFDEWMKVKDSDICNESISEVVSLSNHVLASLKLSYNNMAPCLRSCFTYCSVFPKGHRIAKVMVEILRVVEVSMLGKSADILGSMRDYVAPGFEPSWLVPQNEDALGFKGAADVVASRRASGAYHEDVTSFTMHDLVHDLARSIMGHEILDATKKGNTWGSSSCYALLTDCSKPLGLSTTSTDILKALLFLECDRIELCASAFSSATSLCVLDLSECSIQELPDSIDELKELRYLSAPGIQARSIPDSFTKLSKLHYLTISGSEIVALPESIGEMEGVSQSLGGLMKLQYLNLSDCMNIGDLPRTLGKLTKLQYLNLSNSSYLRVLEAEVLGSLTRLTYLNLSSELSPLRMLPEALGNFIQLRNDNLYGVPETFGKLDKLHTLDLSYCCNLQMLPASISESISLKLLSMMALEERDESILWPVKAGDGESNRTLEAKNPTILVISKLEILKSAEEARRIKLKEKRRIEKLTLEWTNDVDYAKRFVEDIKVMGELVPPRTLRSLKLQGYNSQRFPTWVTCIASILPHLAEIVMVDLPMCNTLPPLGQLLKLERLVITRMNSIKKIDSKFYGGPKAFPKLKYLDVSNMESLEEWDYTTNLEMFHRLWKLCVSGCPKLTFKPSKPMGKNILIRASFPDLGSESVENTSWDPALSSLSLTDSSIVRATISKYPTGTLRPAMENLERIHYGKPYRSPTITSFYELLL